MFEVLVGLNTAILGPLVVDSACWVEERHVAILASTQVDLFQLQFVSGIQVLLRVPEYTTIQDLP